MSQAQQMCLFDLPTLPRPGLHDEAVLEVLLDLFVPKVLEWIDGSSKTKCDYVFNEEYIQSVRNDLRYEIDCPSDGFDICKSLDALGWETDRSAMELFDEVEQYRHLAHAKVLDKWAHENSEPKLQEGTLVEFLWRGEKLVGVIDKIRPATAEYLIRGTDGSTRLVEYELATRIGCNKLASHVLGLSQ